MAIIELYSSRNKNIIDEEGDIYIYDKFTDKLLNQVMFITDDIFHKYNYPDLMNSPEIDVYADIKASLCREHGLNYLYSVFSSPREDIYSWLKKSKKIDNFLDFIELSFNFVETFISGGYFTDRQGGRMSDSSFQEAVEELNHRFKCERVGYQYTDSIIIKVDSEFIHSEVVKPMLRLLNESGGYDGAIEEFLSAHENYRHGENKDCINDCLKSFESLMKSIHLKRGWDFNDKKATSKDLIAGILSNELIPSYLQQQFISLRSMLESGVPTIRNKVSSHGQGENVTTVEDHLCSYMLNITASNLLFLAECERSL